VPFAASDSITLQYIREGATEGVPLVFVNSLGTDLRIWDGVVSHLADHHPLIRYDKRGHGLSDCPPAPYSIRDHTRDLAELLDLLSVHLVHIIGISVGGMIALDFAATYPDRVKSLVLSDTGPVIGTADLWNERIDTLRQRGMVYLAEAIISRWFVADFDLEWPAAYRGYYNMLVRTPVEGYTGTCEAIRDADLTASARNIQVPVLALCGEKDMATPPDLVRGLVDLMPEASYQEIPGAAHLPCVEQPETMAAHIKLFV
jgi:3-oxoadipate enol-lactonase